MSAPSTPTPWKVVSVPHFDSGLVYTSIQPVNVDEEAMKPLAMANGEYHVCRMSHTAAPWRYDYHRANAAFIVEAVNSFEAHKALIAAKEAELSLLSAQREWLKDRLADLQLPANSPKNIEEWLVECGMPTGGIYGRS